MRQKQKLTPGEGARRDENMKGIKKMLLEEIISIVNDNVVDPFGTASLIFHMDNDKAWEEFEQENEGCVTGYFRKNPDFRFSDNYFQWDSDDMSIVSFSTKEQLIKIMGGVDNASEIINQSF